MEDEKNTYIEDIDFLLEEMQNPNYFCRIFTCSDNGRPQTLIKSKVTPVSEEDLEDLIYNKGIEEADNFFVILYADTKGKEKIVGGRLWLNPQPKNINKRRQNNLSGDYNQQTQYNPMVFYEKGAENTMKLMEKMQEGYQNSLDKITTIIDKQEEERKQLLDELKKTYQKREKEDKASENGAGIMNLLGSFAPVIAQGLMNSQNQQNQNIAGFQQRPPNIPANAIPINNISAINKIIDDRKDNNNNEN